MQKGILLGSLAAMLLGACTGQAASCVGTQASCSFNLTTNNGSWNPPGTGNYGSVTLTLIGGEIQFNVQLIGTLGLVAAGGDTFGFNDTASPNYTLFVSGLPTPYGSGDLNSGAHMDSYGTFEHAITSSASGASDCTAPMGTVGGTGCLSDLMFTIGLSGGSFTSVTQLVDGSTSNGGDNGHVPSLFSAHVYGMINGSTTTGFIGGVGPGTAAVPEPTSYLGILSLAFGAVVFGTWRRKRTV